MNNNIFVGIDWAWKEHQVVTVDNHGKLLAEFVVEHSGEGMTELREKLEEIANGEINRIKVAIEVPHGAVVEMLLENLFEVYSINPRQMDRFRDRYSPSGAKDDRRDAFVMADSLRTDESCFRRLELSDPLVIELRQWSRIAEEIQQENVRQANRFREQLLRYYPQFLQVAADISADWALSLWEKAPTPAKGRRLHKSTIKKLLKEHRIRRIGADFVQDKLRQSPLPIAEGVEQAAVAHLRILCERLRLANRQHKQAEKKLKQLCEKLYAETDSDRCGPSDVTVILSLIGVGTTVAATLLAEASQPLRERNYHVLRLLFGTAAVTKRSGKTVKGHMRYACNSRLRNAIYHWARVASSCDPASKKNYSSLRQRGHSHARALRTLGDRLLNVLCAMLRDLRRLPELTQIYLFRLIPTGYRIENTI